MIKFLRTLAASSRGCSLSLFLLFPFFFPFCFLFFLFFSFLSSFFLLGSGYFLRISFVITDHGGEEISGTWGCLVYQPRLFSVPWCCLTRRSTLPFDIHFPATFPFPPLSSYFRYKIFLLHFHPFATFPPPLLSFSSLPCLPGTFNADAPDSHLTEKFIKSRNIPHPKQPHDHNNNPHNTNK